MSTINKAIADRIINGEFAEDDTVAIIRYENMFNGDYAYKLITQPQIDNGYLQWLLDGKEYAIIDPTIYWRKPQ